MLGFPLLYFKGMRLLMFQLSGFYYKAITRLEIPKKEPTSKLCRNPVLLGAKALLEPIHPPPKA